MTAESAAALTSLFKYIIEYPDYYIQNDADQNHCCYWEIKSKIISFNFYVPREVSNPGKVAARKVNYYSYHCNDKAKDNHCSPKIVKFHDYHPFLNSSAFFVGLLFFLHLILHNL